MIKVWKIVGMAAVVVTIGLFAALPALAEEPAESVPMWQRMQQWFRGNAAGEREFVDEDGDGVCDVCGEVPGESGFGRGMGMWGRGVDVEREFVDEDGDGVCDTCGVTPGEGGLSRGMGMWGRGVNGEREFVDEDGDGVCDTCGVVPGEGGELGPCWGLGADGEREFVDEDGDGLCDVCGQAEGGRAFPMMRGGMMRGGMMGAFRNR